jgi:hypothetical protein
MELSRLEQDHSKWKKKAQQTAMSLDEISDFNLHKLLCPFTIDEAVVFMIIS